MRNLVSRVRRWWRPGRRSAVAVPYEIACACGHVVRGQRQTRHQVVRCDGCQQPVFVLPCSPLPGWSIADVPAVNGAPARPATRPSPWRFWLAPAVGGGLALLFAGVIIYVVVSALRPSHPPSIPAPEAVEPHVEAGRKALAEGKFRLAADEFQKASALLKRQPDRERSDFGRDLLQLRRQAELLAKLLAEPLGDLLQQAPTNPEWPARFETSYKGSAVVFDADVTRDGAGQPRLEFAVEAAGMRPARIDVRDLKLLTALPRERPARLLFGARLASIAVEGQGVWVVRFDPDSGVLLTDPGAVAAACPPPADDAERKQRDDLLKQQREWLDNLP